MWKDAYLESRVLAANPLELVQILYRHATESVQEARRRLADGSIAARSKAIGNAIGAISELEVSLDHSVEGTISRDLGELYRYMRRRLTEANVRQQDGPLAEVESLLATLSDAWRAMAALADKPEPAVTRHPEPQAMVWQDTESAGAHMWSA